MNCIEAFANISIPKAVMACKIIYQKIVLDEIASVCRLSKHSDDDSFTTGSLTREKKAFGALLFFTGACYLGACTLDYKTRQNVNSLCARSSTWKV